MNCYRIHVGHGKSFLIAAPSFTEAIQTFSQWEQGLASKPFYKVQSIECIDELRAICTTPQETNKP